jgi:acyl carrier protein
MAVLGCTSEAVGSVLLARFLIVLRRQLEFHSERRTERDPRIEVGELGQSIMSVDQAADISEQMKQLTAYISEKVMKGKGAAINEDTPLVSSGLIDSFAMIEIFLELQRIATRKVPASKVQAKDMDTVRSMFAMVEKFGKPVKS